MFDIAAGLVVTVAGYVAGNAVDRKFAGRARPWRRPELGVGNAPLPRLAAGHIRACGLRGAGTIRSCLSFGHVDLLWLVAGVVLHLCSQLARGRGWFSVLCAAHPPEDRPRRRDVLATWVAGAGASGVLSARGGDALRVLLMKRRMRTTCPTLVGTLAAETVAETALGAALTLWALSAGLVPGLHLPGLATGAAIVAGVAALWLVLRRAARRVPGARARGRRTPSRASRCSAAPARYARRVVPWGMLSRALRLTSLACFLAAFGLAVSLTAVLVVMVAHSGGRLVPFGPAGAGASLALLVAALPARNRRRRRPGDRVLPRHDRHADRGRDRALGPPARAARSGSAARGGSWRPAARAAQGTRARARRLAPPLRSVRYSTLAAPGQQLALARGALVAARLRPRLLAAELVVRGEALGREAAVGERRRHRAAGLAGVPAVGEAAAARQRLDVGEHAREAARLLPDPRQLEPRRVDHHAAARQRHELAHAWSCGGRGRRRRGSARSPARRPPAG